METRHTAKSIATPYKILSHPPQHMATAEWAKIQLRQVRVASNISLYFSGCHLRCHILKAVLIGTLCREDALTLIRGRNGVPIVERGVS